MEGLTTSLSVTVLNTGFGKPLVTYVYGKDLTPYAPFRPNVTSTTTSGPREQKWHPCAGGTTDSTGSYKSGPDPVGHVSCMFAVDLTTGWVGVRQSWICYDKDAEHP